MDQEHRNALPVGHEFEGYRIEGVLGVGGFGMTYLASEHALGRKVAIKEYLPSGLAMRAPEDMSVRPISQGDIKDYYWGLERFRQEAETLVNFHHPNIVAVHRFFEGNGTAYLVMQFVEGQSLDQILTRQRTMAEPELLRFLMPILDGLEEVHRVGFLHRDIKPANIYIRTDGTPILLDFSAARQALTRHSVTLTAIVSDGYAPYEQYGSGGQLGAWTDIYGLGAVLYRCISGQRPVQAPDRLQALVNGQRDPLSPATVAGHGRYGVALLQAIDVMLRVFEKERPQTVASLRTLIRTGNLQAAGLSHPVSGPSRANRGHPSRRGETAAAPTAPEALPDAVPAPKRRNRALSAVALGALLVVVAGAGFVVGSRGTAPAGDAAARVPAPEDADRAGRDEKNSPPSTIAAIPPALPRADPEPAKEPERAAPPAAPAIAGFTDCAGCPEMVAVPAGTGVFGSPAAEIGREADEEVQRRIAVTKPFALGRNEVTRAQFARFVADAGYKIEAGCFAWTGKQWALDRARSWQDPGFAQTENDPVVCVSGKDADAYVAWLSAKTKKPYRLPTEIEWEYAARAGSTEARSWGDDAGELCRHGNAADQDARKSYPEWPAVACRDGFVHTAPVGSFKPNAFGLNDMLGNAAEWTADCWRGPGADAAAVDTAAAAQDCARRVVRGGAFNYTQRLLRAAARLKANTTGRIFNLGFRVARDAE